MDEKQVETKRITGKDLRVGNIIKVWWFPNLDTIVSLEPYSGAYERDPEWKGVQFAGFLRMTCGMTVFPDEDFDKIVKT